MHSNRARRLDQPVESRHDHILGAADADITEFFGITESSLHKPNEIRIAFWAQSIAEVDRLGQLASRLGAKNIEGPMNYEPGYYAVFLEDPCGNRLEICHRVKT